MKLEAKALFDLHVEKNGIVAQKKETKIIW